ncbi:MAG: hypothetical protein NVSMB27_17830 [Ktedonobacteraceae bacterium]
MDTVAAFQQEFEALQRDGLLLESDSQLPSVASIIAGEAIRGSWWGHPQGNFIYQVANKLCVHPDILVTKLISGKITYVHRQLWPAIIGIGTSGEPWQLQDLSEAAQWLLDKVTQEHSVTTDQLQLFSSYKPRALADAARELEKKLIIYSESFHSMTGAHYKRLETWARWISRVGFTEKPMAAEAGKHALEDIVFMLNDRFGAKGKLPWIGA